MNYNTETLANGLRLIHLPSPSNVIYCGYEVGVGTRHEKAGEEGLAHFCEHLTFKGTARRRAWHIINALERVGGELNAFTNKEDTVYHSAVLKEYFPRAVELLTDIVFHSVYPQNEVEKEVEVICDEIESYRDSPAELIYDDFENAIFRGHPLGHNILGEPERLRTYRREDAVRFTKTHYRADNAVFFVSGNIDFARLVKKLSALHQSPPMGKLATNRQEIASREANAKQAVRTGYGTGGQRIEVEKGTHQAHVMLGGRAFDVHDVRRMPLYLLNNILGGPGMNARLNLSLRERNALVYSVESSMVSYSDAGAWAVYFGCDPHDVEKCLKLVRKELDQMMEKRLTDSQLRMAKKQIRGQIGIACDAREQFALDFGKSFLHYGWQKDISTLFEDIEKVTAEDLQQVACELFEEERITTLIYR